MQTIRARACALALATIACAPPSSNGSAEPILEATGPARTAVREQAIASPIRVLTLPAPWDTRNTLIVEPAYYAVSAYSPEVSIGLQGTNVLHHPGDGRPAPQREQQVRGFPALVTQDEGIRSITWAENGVFYALDVECAHPFSDPRCTEDAFIVELANALVEVQP
jgi:hypothetical protein